MKIRIYREVITRESRILTYDSTNFIKYFKYQMEIYS